MHIPSVLPSLNYSAKPPGRMGERSRGPGNASHKRVKCPKEKSEFRACEQGPGHEALHVGVARTLDVP